MKVFPSSEGNVWKYVFDFNGAVAEAVLYRYGSFEERTVLCVSVQSGCPVGCTFCGTGNRFIRNLTTDEIRTQVGKILADKRITGSKKFQIMFMSMGEPFLNYENVHNAIVSLHKIHPAAQLLVSTMAPNQPESLRRFISLSESCDAVGLQFSIHSLDKQVRDKLIPFKQKLSLIELRNYGIEWWHATNRQVYLNYVVTGDTDVHAVAYKFTTMFPANAFALTFSVLCSPDESMKTAGYRDMDKIERLRDICLDQGFNTRVFDPAGQDDIGGGCGQLWYVQKALSGGAAEWTE